MFNVIGNYAYGEPCATGTLRASFEDFVVVESLGFEPCGEGEHLFCFIEKRGLNTEDVVKKLSAIAKISINHISYAGLKDKNAVTRQWFSLHIPGKITPDLSALNSQSIQIIKIIRHNKKLKRGALRENNFCIRITNIQGAFADIKTRFALVEQNGVPNYFGEQRFGREQHNIIKARELLFDGVKVNNRHLKGLYLSAARSYLFNHLLSQRVANKTWNSGLDGDVMQLTGSHSIFVADAIDEFIARRLQDRDISPAGMLFGVGERFAKFRALDFEQESFIDFHDWIKALARFGLKLSYRAFVLQPNNMRLNLNDDNSVTFKFSLPVGSYATAVLREIISSSYN